MSKEEIEYDKHVDFYWSNLVNALKLFSYSKNDLEKLIGPGFDPIFELGTEIDYAFTPVLFQTILRNNLIDEVLKNELLDFKKQTDEIPNEIWFWELIDKHPTWTDVRRNANELLDKLGVTDRNYNEEYTTVYDRDGRILKRGDKVNSKT